MTWPGRIASALKPGRCFARHYTRDDLAAALKVPSGRAFGRHLTAAHKASLVVVEPWGPVKATYRLPDIPVCEPTRLFLEGYAPPRNRDYSTWLPVRDHERELGLGYSALGKWLANHDLLVVCPKPGKERLTPPAVLAYYLEQTTPKNVTRVPCRPEGWPGKVGALEMIGATDRALRAAVERGELEAVRVGHVQYYDPEGLRRLAFALKETPLPGWEMVLARAKARAADPMSAADWLQRNGHEVRRYRTSDRQLALYALSTALDLWEQYHAAYSVRALTPEQVRNVRQGLIRGATNYAVAKAHGVDVSTVRGIRLGQIYRLPTVGFAEVYARQQARLSETARRLPHRLPYPDPPPVPVSVPPAPVLPEPLPEPEPLELILSRSVGGGMIDPAELSVTGLHPRAVALAAQYAGAVKVQPRQGRRPRRVLVRWAWAQDFLDEVLPGWREYGEVPERLNGGALKSLEG